MDRSVAPLRLDCRGVLRRFLDTTGPSRSASGRRLRPFARVRRHGRGRASAPAHSSCDRARSNRRAAHDDHRVRRKAPGAVRCRV